MPKISPSAAIVELKELLSRGKLIVLVGAGVSIDSGLPTWETLLKNFIKMCHTLPFREEEKAELDSLLKAADPHVSRDPIRVATVIKDRLKRLLKNNTVASRKYKNWLLSEFYTAAPNIKHDLLVQTNFPFILTTNYDLLLEEAAMRLGFPDLSEATYTFKKGSELAGAIATRRPCIVHIHGIVDNLESGELIFTQDEYRQMIKSRYEGFSFALRMLFFDYSVLYVGYGASDPHLEDINQDLTSYFPSEQPIPMNTSYLILKEDKIDEVLVEYKDKLRTKLIPIKDYKEIDEMLIQLRDAAPRKPNTKKRPSDPQQELPGVD